jgi:hypothetical protein
VRFFFDNNLSQHLAHAIHELCRIEPMISEAIHLRDRFPPNIKDHDWINALAQDGDWVVISQDGLQKNDLEREALRQSGLIVFALHKQWAGQSHWPKSQNLVRWWPSILAQSQKIRGGAAFRVPWRHSGGGRFDQIRL